MVAGAFKNLRIALTSTNKIKSDVLHTLEEFESITCFDCNGDNFPPQPVGLEGAKFCINGRVANLYKQLDNNDASQEFDIIISFENYIVFTNDPKRLMVDRCLSQVNIFRSPICYDNIGYVNRNERIIPQEYCSQVIRTIYLNTPSDYKFLKWGLAQTSGNVLHSLNKVQFPDPGNWMKDRNDQIDYSLDMVDPIGYFKLKKLIKTYPDYPKPGVVFQSSLDMFSTYNMVYLMDIFRSVVCDSSITHVMGLDARGFTIMPLIQRIISELHNGIPYLVHCRKISAKLPGECISVKYTTEYSEDGMKIQKDAIKEGDKVIIVDDLVATGGSLKAACEA